MAAEQEWDDAASGGGVQFPSVALEGGENRVRLLVSRPYFYHSVWVDIPVPGQPGQSKPRQIVVGDDRSAVINAGLTPQKTNFIPVYNYRTKKAEMLEFGPMLAKAIATIVSDADFGPELTKYDLKITKTGQRLDTRYTALPGGKTEGLSAEHIAAFDVLKGLGDYTKDFKPAMSMDEQQAILAQLRGAQPGLRGAQPAGEAPTRSQASAEAEKASSFFTDD